MSRPTRPQCLPPQCPGMTPARVRTNPMLPPPRRVNFPFPASRRTRPVREQRLTHPVLPLPPTVRIRRTNRLRRTQDRPAAALREDGICPRWKTLIAARVKTCRCRAITLQPAIMWRPTCVRKTRCALSRKTQPRTLPWLRLRLHSKRPLRPSLNTEPACNWLRRETMRRRRDVLWRCWLRSDQHHR